MTPDQQKALALAKARRRRAEFESGSTASSDSAGIQAVQQMGKRFQQGLPLQERNAPQKPLVALPDGMTQADIDANRQRALEEHSRQSGPIKAAAAFTAKTLGFGDNASDKFGEFVGDTKNKFTGDYAKTEETESLPRLTQLNVALGKDLKRAAALVVASSPEERMLMIQKIVPGTTFRYDEMGNVIGKFPDGREGILNKPGFDTTDALKFSTITAMYANPAASASGLAAGLGTKTLGKMALQGGAAALTAAGAEKTSEALGGEFEGDEVAIAGAMGAGAEFGASMAGKAKGILANRAKKALGSEGELVADTVQNARTAREASDALEVGLNQPQQTLNPKQVQDLEIGAGSTGGSTTARTAFKEQNREISTAVNSKILDKTAPETALDSGAERLRDAATKAVDNLKEARTNAATEFYRKAYTLSPKIDSEPTRKLVGSYLTRFKEGNTARSFMKRVEKLISKADDGKQPTLQQLHDARKQIDDWIDFEVQPKINRDGIDALKSVRASINKQIGSTGPAGSLFRKGDEVFAEMSDPVKKLEDSLVGKLSRRADGTVQLGAQDIFSSNRVSMKRLLEAKSKIDEVDPGAWGDIYRIELQDRLSKLPPGRIEGVGGDALTDLTDNLPAKLYRVLIGTGEKFDRLVQLAPNEEVAKNLRYMKTVLERAQIGRDVNSKTAQRSRRVKELASGGVMGFLGKALNAIDSASDAFKGYTYDQRMRALTESLTDTKWRLDMRKIRALPINSPQAATEYEELLGNILRATAPTSTSGNE